MSTRREMSHDVKRCTGGISGQGRDFAWIVPDGWRPDKESRRLKNIVNLDSEGLSRLQKSGQFVLPNPISDPADNRLV